MPCMTCNGYLYAASLHVVYTNMVVLCRSNAEFFTVYNLMNLMKRRNCAGRHHTLPTSSKLSKHVLILHSLQVILTCLQHPQISGNLRIPRLKSGSGGQKQNRKFWQVQKFPGTMPTKDPMPAITLLKDGHQQRRKQNTSKSCKRHQNTPFPNQFLKQMQVYHIVGHVLIQWPAQNFSGAEWVLVDWTHS